MSSLTESYLENALTHLKEMLADRRVGTEGLNVTAKELMGTYGVSSFELDKTIVLFCLAKDSIKEAKARILEDLEGSNDECPLTPRCYLIVSMDKPSPNMNISLDDLDRRWNACGGMVQVFLLKELQYNPSRHSLVPLHEKVPEEDTKALLEKYQLKNRFLLPLILRQDVMAKYLGMRHGDIVKISRRNQTSGEYTYYRCCM